MTAQVKEPFVFTLALRARAGAVVLARDLVTMAFEQWGLERLDYNGRLIMSELTTNAVRACEEDAEITVRVWRADGGDPVLEVSDPSPLLPVYGNADLEAERGRGLFIVNLLAKDLIVLRRTGTEKTVRAVMDAT
ncbi:ATP-binding protein [Spirillospora sp. NPDC029432]|uniref:ATP-binding protein n=1 Tax=Spirillospora sp. NPDC029432 TaxID=3154599 RepID=UPI003454EDF5